MTAAGQATADKETPATLESPFAVFAGEPSRRARVSSLEELRGASEKHRSMEQNSIQGVRGLLGVGAAEDPNQVGL